LPEEVHHKILTAVLLLIFKSDAYDAEIQARYGLDVSTHRSDLQWLTVCIKRRLGKTGGMVMAAVAFLLRIPNVRILALKQSRFNPLFTDLKLLVERGFGAKIHSKLKIGLS
jgi:hypothetical protein